MIAITAIHLAGGVGHQHIASVRWLDTADGQAGQSDTATMVAFVDGKTNPVRVGGPDGWVSVGAVHPKNGNPYLRSFADGMWTDNLLALATY